MGLWKFSILVIVLGRRGFTTLLILLTWMTEQPFHSPQAPLLTVYSVSSPLASAGEAVGQALWQGWASEQRSVGRCICAKWLGGGCAQHDASPACPPLPLQWWWVLLGLGNPQIFCVSSIPVCCSDVKWDRSFHLFKIKISHLSKTLKSLKDVGFFVKLVMHSFFSLFFPNPEDGCLFRGKEAHLMKHMIKIAY